MVAKAVDPEAGTELFFFSAYCIRASELYLGITVRAEKPQLVVA